MCHFCTMKFSRTIIFRAIIFLTVISCFRINTYSNSSVIQNSIECSSLADADGNNFKADTESDEEDQITGYQTSCAFLEISIDLQIPESYFQILQIDSSIFQPPKIS